MKFAKKLCLYFCRDIFADLKCVCRAEVQKETTPALRQEQQENLPGEEPGEALDTDERMEEVPENAEEQTAEKTEEETVQGNVFIRSQSGTITTNLIFAISSFLKLHILIVIDIHTSYIPDNLSKAFKNDLAAYNNC